MTEDEAKKRICCGAPFMVVPAAISTANKGLMEAFADASDANAPGYCRASECMAWRWIPPINRIGEPTRPYKGFCGLAGASQ